MTKKCKIIVEIASNHFGDMDLANEFIKISSEMGADYVKFQSSRYQDLVNKNDFQAEWVRKTSLSNEAHYLLIESCKKYNIPFLTTCFTKSRIKFLASLGLKEIKVASPDLLSFAMIKELALKFEHLIISTGMHTVNEISKNIEFLKNKNINATLLHSISLYPTPLDQSWMNKFLWLCDNYDKVGYSNHTADIDVIKFAMDNGAKLVEVHMKLGENGPGRASAWDLLPSELEEIVMYRDKLSKMRGLEVQGNENWLSESEIAAKKRFIGRWGNNT